MATNSTFRIQKLVDSAARRTDLAPALAAAGHSDQPAIDIANEVATALIRGGSYDSPSGRMLDTGRMNWKWNRINVIPSPVAGTVLSSVGGYGTFLTNVSQQDYAVPGVINLDWLEEAVYVNINQLTSPKQVLWAEVKRNLSKEYIPVGSAGRWKVCFLPNSVLDYGIWGQSAQYQVDGLLSPGPNVVYSTPLGPGAAPNNPVTQIQDPATNNLYVLTTFGTCGAVPPTFPGTVAYPTMHKPATVATTVNDGTCVWTALNPNGMGFRLGFPPAGNSQVWLWRVTAQMLPPQYQSLQETLGVIPDDMVPYFRAGFDAKCVERSPDAKVRAKFHGPTGLWALWLNSLRQAVQSQTQEQEDQQLVPGGASFGGGAVAASAAYPFPGGWE